METKAKSKVKNPIQLCKPKQEKGWFNGKDYVPFDKMSNSYLQNAFMHCRKKVLFYHNRMMVFDELSERLEQEAAKRQLVLIEPDTQFEKNTRHLKEVVNDTEK